MDKTKIMMCRCEDVTLADLHQKIDEGYHTFEDLKRLLRIGMGPCQANTCGHLIQRELASYLKKPVTETRPHKSRPVIQGISLEAIAKEAKK
ncbi:MAG: (2Fe-2S)-binding protein [Acholeplasmataceae bacterium]|nr:(2Fe-2S)-binding protein [Acholeplasmataceae bacterium]